jgi:hypothetical protein
LNFLTPSILFALAAAALPLLIHLFTRSKAKKIAFSSLVFLQELSHQNIRRLKLRQVLLLILRTLIVLFLVLAFARPAMRSNLAYPNAKTTGVVILDNSYSMNSIKDGRPLQLDAKQIACAVLDHLSFGDEVFLITTTDTSVEMSRHAYHDMEALKKQIITVETDYHLTDMTASLKYAQKLLNRSQNINKEIYIISDFQKVSFRSTVTPLKNIKIFAVPTVQQNITNLGISNVELKNTILEKDKVVEFDAVFDNWGPQPVRDHLAQLVVNGRKVAQSLIAVEKSSSQKEKFKYVLNETGFMAGYMLLEEDDIREDNRRYFSFYVPDQYNVALIGQNPDDVKYIEMALVQPNVSQQRFTVERIPQERIRFSQFDKYQVIVFSNYTTFDEILVEKIKSFVESGGGLLLIAGTSSDVKSYNRFLVPQLRLPKFIDVIEHQDTTQSYFSLGKTDTNHPLFLGIFENDAVAFTRPQFRFALKVQDDNTIDKIMQFSTGDPFLYEKKFPLGTILVFTSGFDNSMSDFTHRTIFAPLITQCINYLGSLNNSYSQLLGIGEEFHYKLAPEYAEKSLEILRPDQRNDQVRPEMESDGLWIYYSNSNVPGIYTLKCADRILCQWAVNTDPLESELAPASISELETKYGMTVVENRKNLATVIQTTRYGHEFWKYFIILVFILLICEMLLYREKGEVTVKTNPKERI